MNKEKTKYTKAGLMLYLYDIPFSFVAKLFGKEEQKRKYKIIVEGNYQRIDLSILDNICKFLNVTPSVVLDGLVDNDSPKVYIKNIYSWIDYDVYILFRSTKIVEDVFNEETKTIEHNISFEHASEPLYNRNGFNSLVRYATALFTPIPEPREIKVKGLGNYCHNKEKYFNQIKPYLMKFMDEDTIEFKLSDSLKALLKMKREGE